LLAPIALWAGAFAAARNAPEERMALVIITSVISSACLVLLLLGVRLRRVRTRNRDTHGPDA
jgi:hypothetical protein